MPRKAQWTVLNYIAAHNNLDQFGKRSRDEIVGVGSTEEVVQGVLLDSHAGSARYVAGEPGRVRDQQLLGKAFDSGDPEELIRTARWLYEQYPAERYGLVLWSHGTGWEPAEIEEIAQEARPGVTADEAESKERAAGPGSRCLFRTTLRALLTPEQRSERAILFDDGTGHSLDTLELARVTTSIAAAVGRPLDLLGMDACLMANLEVACELRDSVRSLVASPELVPGHSWPYPQIYSALRAQPQLDGPALATLVVEHYLAYYRSQPPRAGDVTKVALDLGRIDALLAAAGGLADVLVAHMNTAGDALWTAQRVTQARETSNGVRQPSKFDYDLWDLGSVASELAGTAGLAAPVQVAARGVVDALRPGRGCVLCEGHEGAWFDGSAGTSVFLMPPGKQRIAPDYAQLAFARTTRWDRMLEAYHGHFA